MQNTKFQTYRNYIALDWSKDIAAVAIMRDSVSSPVKKLLPADIRSLIAYLKSFKGSKILAIEETSSSHWLYFELFDWVDKILVWIHTETTYFPLFGVPKSLHFAIVIFSVQPVQTFGSPTTHWKNYSILSLCNSQRTLREFS